MIGEVFRDIEQTLARCDGWCEVEKAHALAAMVFALRPKLVVEIGVFGSRSLQAFAIPMKFLNHGCAIGIDSWSREAAIAGMTDEKNLEYWGNLDYERIYQRCLTNISLSDLGPYAKIIRAKSDDVDPAQFPSDITHIDGSHEDTAYRDVVRYAPHVRIGGMIVADDVGWVSGAPQRGVEWMLSSGFIQLYPLGTGAVFQRIK